MLRQIVHFLRIVYNKLRLGRLKYTLPFVVLALYTVLGAYIFRSFELKADEERRIQYRKDSEYAFDEVLKRLLVTFEPCNSLADRNIRIRQTKDALFWFIDYLNLTNVIEDRSDDSPWTWMTSLFYAGQLYTTIGYGFPVAQTSGGRLASILYIMVGIPIFLIILAEVGKILSRALRKLYKRYKNAKIAGKLATRRMSEPVKAIYSLTTAMASIGGSVTSAATPIFSKNTMNNMIGDAVIENQMETTKLLDHQTNESPKQADNINAAENQEHLDDDQKQKETNKLSTTFPIPLALLMLIFWILFSAALFCLWETEWGYLTSIYFFFISISTVGLGDIVPTKPDMMFINFFMILIGLALLSMCVNLIQEALERLMEKLIEQYIDEIEKIALIVNTETDFSEINEFAEELSPLQMGTVEMQMMAEAKPHSFAQTVKDWVAEQASNVLLNRLYPEKVDSSSGEEDDEEEDDGNGELEEVVVTGAPTIYSTEVITVAEHRPSLAEAIEPPGDVPQISVHECTPSSEPGRINSIKRIRNKKQHVRISETLSTTSADAEKGTKKDRHRKKRHASPFIFRGTATLLSLNQPMLHALQMIGSSPKMHSAGEKGEDFKIVEENAKHSPAFQPRKANMVSSGIQTTPPISPHLGSRVGWKFRGIGESMDSGSSELNTQSSGGVTNEHYDADSLFCSGYFDLQFGCYSTDSVPRLLADPNTPMPPSSPIPLVESQATMHPLAMLQTSTGLYHDYGQQIILQTDEQECDDSGRVPVPFPVSPSQQRRRVGWGIMRHAYSTPSTPPTATDSIKSGQSSPATAPQSPPMHPIRKHNRCHPAIAPSVSNPLPLQKSKIPIRPNTLKQMAMVRRIAALASTTPNSTPSSMNGDFGQNKWTSMTKLASPLISSCFPPRHPAFLTRRRFSETTSVSSSKGSFFGSDGKLMHNQGDDSLAFHRVALNSFTGEAKPPDDQSKRSKDLPPTGKEQVHFHINHDSSDSDDTDRRLKDDIKETLDMVLKRVPEKYSNDFPNT